MPSPAHSAPAAAFSLAGRPVLIATDGSAGAIAAVRVAFGLEKTHGALIHIINVVDTSSAPISGALHAALAIGDAIAGAGVHAEQEQAIRAAILAEVGQPVEWPIRIVMGTPASAIVREAQSIGAALIVMGLRRHGPIGRVVNDETVRNVMQRAPCPVLGVVAGTTELPKRVLVALDFSSTSLSAARTVRSIVRDGGHIVLVYVEPATQSLPEDGVQLIHDLGVHAAFARTRGELEGPDVTVDHFVLHRDRPGSPGVLLLDSAEDSRCDLIAAGSARHGRIERWLLGSVSTEIVRDGRFSVLIVPPSDTAKG